MGKLVPLLAMLAGGVALIAQQGAPAPDQLIRHELLAEQSVIARAPSAGPAAAPQVHIEFIAAEVSPGAVVKGAPYSAEAITETVQTLADGNRIRRKTTAMIYRDSQGRTRREQSLGAVIPWGPAKEPVNTVFISDPVAGLNYILEPGTRTARKMTKPAATPKAHVAEPGEEDVFEHVFIPGVIAHAGTPAPAAAIEVKKGTETRVFTHKAAAPAKTESLGKRMIEGVEAEGIRTTVVIPAGEIGNERPIEIVSERWYSPELQVVVYSKRSDPRFGETTYRLVNVNRTEPLALLFQAPPDYTVKEGPPVIRSKARAVKESK